MSVVGLDFGNDSSKVAVAKNKGIEVLQVTFPSPNDDVTSSR
jgi:molecular chaperone DnaK (HSP70)